MDEQIATRENVTGCCCRAHAGWLQMHWTTSFVLDVLAFLRAPRVVRMAQWIRRLPTEQEILGSSPSTDFTTFCVCVCVGSLLLCQMKKGDVLG